MKMSLDVRIPQNASELKNVFKYKNVSEYNIFNFELPQKMPLHVVFIK